MEIKSYENMKQMEGMDNKIICAIRDGLDALDHLHDVRTNLVACSICSYMTDGNVFIKDDGIYEKAEALLEQATNMEHELRSAIDDWTRKSNEIEDAIEEFKKEMANDDASA